jgi:hypothetical protein
MGRATDIVTRLREMAQERRQRGEGATVSLNGIMTDWIEEAAREVERLRADNGELRMKYNTGWAIKGKHRFYAGWHPVRREIIAQHVADIHLGKWPAFGGDKLSDAQAEAWKKCQAVGDRAVKIKISEVQ